MRRVPSSVLLLSVLVACGDSSATSDPAKVQQETASASSRVAQILQSVKDHETAQKAKAELQQLATQLERKVAALKQDWTGGKSVQDAAKGWLDKAKTALSTESRQAFANARRELERIQQDPQLNVELRDVVERVKAALAGL